MIYDIVNVSNKKLLKINIWKENITVVITNISHESIIVVTVEKLIWEEMIQVFEPEQKGRRCCLNLSNIVVNQKHTPIPTK